MGMNLLHASNSSGGERISRIARKKWLRHQNDGWQEMLKGVLVAGSPLNDIAAAIIWCALAVGNISAMFAAEIGEITKANQEA